MERGFLRAVPPSPPSPLPSPAAHGEPVYEKGGSVHKLEGLHKRESGALLKRGGFCRRYERAVGRGMQPVYVEGLQKGERERIGASRD